MNKIFLYICAIFVLVMQGCEKDITSYDESKITYYADIALKGNLDYVMYVGEEYKEPGFEAIMKDKDVKDKVNIAGTVDNTKGGYNKLVYSVINDDGFEAVVSRNVFVLPNDAKYQTDISGVYSGAKKGSSLSEGACVIKKLAEGFYVASDFFGGYYNIVRGYGSGYRLKTYFYIKDDKSIAPIATFSPWGPWSIKDGIYDESSKQLNFKSQYSPDFGFEVQLVLEGE